MCLPGKRDFHTDTTGTPSSKLERAFRVSNTSAGLWSCCLVLLCLQETEFLRAIRGGSGPSFNVKTAIQTSAIRATRAPSKA